VNRVARGLLALAAGTMVIAAAIHARSFPAVSQKIVDSDLSRFLVGALEALWLGDSTTLTILAALLVLIALRPRTADPALLAGLALIPAATGMLIYWRIGAFFAGHMMIACALAILAAAALGRRSRAA
jgi:hypothetical protein